MSQPGSYEKTIYGQSGFLIHRASENAPDKWAITHLPTGRIAAFGRTPAKALNSLRCYCWSQARYRGCSPADVLNSAIKLALTEAPKGTINE